MAAPTAPTLVSITTEGLKKAGYSSPSTPQLTRAQDEWMEEIKQDIWEEAKKLKSLMKTAIYITTEGLDRVAMPADYSSDMTMKLLDGSVTGTAQSGAVGSITLEATDTSLESDLKKKKGILVYSGTGKGSYSQITAYNTSTKVASVSPNFNTAPVNGDGYMLVDYDPPIKQKPVWVYDDGEPTTEVGEPRFYFPTGDDDNGEFILSPKPFRESGIPYGIQFRYYADLTRVDLASTLMTTLYRRWRSLFVLGVQAKALDAKDDKRADKKIRSYHVRLGVLVTREEYGMDINDLQMQVTDY
jgi:hypothetical protein